jgi:putative transcriptional regulator
MANRIRELREARGLSQGDLAKLLGVTERTVRLWEKGTAVPWERHRNALARRLGVTVADLALE